MIADTNPWAAAARQVATLARRAADADAPVAAEILADALRVLVWLAGERVTPPHSVVRGTTGTVHFHWHQGKAGFEVRVLAPGRLSWRADGVADDDTKHTGRKLDREAAGLLRSLIPLARPYRPARDSEL